MNKQFKKILSAALSLTMVAGSIVLPTMASAEDVTPIVEGDTVLKEWKFDFGAEGSTPKNGYTLVTPDRNVVKTKDYGFIGNDESVTTNMEKYDSFIYKAGMVVTLKAGENGIGVEKQEDAPYPEFTTGEYYPTSFGLYVSNNTYYRVRAEVSTLDNTKDAEASLYYERRRPAMHKQKIAAGQTKTVDFSVDVETINFKNEGNFVDDMLNISLLGENAALKSLVIQQIDTKVDNPPVTLWVIGDSTVTDGSAALPYFDLQNYTGVGAYLSKYVPSNVAVSNQGEGGLNATDNNHFVIAKDKMKKNDFMYVEYGHNHKDDSNSPGPVGYLSCLSKYYDACKAAGATLVLVGPIDRHNSTQYNSSTNTWSTTLSQFSKAAKYYVDIIKTAGKAKADAFVTKAAEEKNGNNVSDTTYAWADEVIAAGVTADAYANVAFVDLNQPTLDWLTTVTASGTVKDKPVTNDISLSNFYFQTSKGAKTDGTHPNDAGADALAQTFFTTADLTAYPVLAPLMTRVTDGKTDVQPVPVSDEIINLGYPSNDAWPVYQSLASYEFATRITGVNFDENGVLKSVDVLPLDKSMMSGYSRAYFALYNKETGVLEDVVASTGHVDNTQDGSQNLAFETDMKVGANQTYKVYLWGYEDNPEAGNPTTMQPYAYPYTPITIGDPIIKNASGEMNETFEYEGVENEGSLDGKGGWATGGTNQTATDTDFSYHEENGKTYAHIYSNGSKTLGAANNDGSAYIYKKFDAPVSSGRIMMDFDFRYKDGNPNILFVSEGDPWKWPASLNPFKASVDGEGKTVVSMNGVNVGSISPKQWTHIHYELDLDEGYETMQIDGGTPVKHVIDAYQTTDLIVSPASLDQIVFEYVNKASAFDFDITNLKLTKLGKDPLPKYTASVVSSDETMGTASIVVGEDAPVTTGEYDLNTVVTLKAEPEDGYRLNGWYDGNELLSEETEYSFRLRKDTEITAKFEEKPGYTDIASYKIKATETSVKLPIEEDKEITLTAEDVVSAKGVKVPVDSTNAEEVVWTLETTDAEGVTLTGNVLTVPSTFTLPETSQKDIVVKCKVNDIEKEVTIMLHTYNYLMNMSFDDGEVTEYLYTTTESVWKEANGQTWTIGKNIIGRGGHTITTIDSPFGGHASHQFLDGNGTRSGAATFTEMKGDALVVDFDLGIGEKSFVKLGNACNKVQADVSATFLALEPTGGKLKYYDYADSTFKDTGLTSSTDNKTYSSLYHVTAAVDFKAKTETVTITPYENGAMNEASAVTLNLDITNATADSFSMVGVSHEASGGTIHVLIDNISVRTDSSSAQ